MAKLQNNTGDVGQRCFVDSGRNGKRENWRKLAEQVVSWGQVLVECRHNAWAKQFLGVVDVAQQEYLNLHRYVFLLLDGPGIRM